MPCDPTIVYEKIPTESLRGNHVRFRGMPWDVATRSRGVGVIFGARRSRLGSRVGDSRESKTNWWDIVGARESSWELPRNSRGSSWEEQAWATIADRDSTYFIMRVFA